MSVDRPFRLPVCAAASVVPMVAAGLNATPTSGGSNAPDPAIKFDTSLRLLTVLPLPPDEAEAVEEGDGPFRLKPNAAPRPWLDYDAEMEQIELPEYDASADAQSWRLQYERQTQLVDGGFGRPPSSDETASSYFESKGERFDRYALSLEWTPGDPDDDLQWLVIGGLHAIRANIGKLNQATLGLTEARGMVAIPTVGTGFRWAPTDGLSFSTTAATQSIDQSASMLEIVFSAQIRLAPLVGLTAGYEFYRSDMTVEDLRTSLNREGVFAKLSIRF
ncbi:MAG: hypothetical protein H6810_07110 [Phycisphaeraceae bacterium]|nr:MAG: hypothetical protein H6810_07110 [Phycisphaeraceae bacterium]